MLLLLPTSVYNIITTLLQSPKKNQKWKTKEKAVRCRRRRRRKKKVVLKKNCGKNNDRVEPSCPNEREIWLKICVYVYLWKIRDLVTILTLKLVFITTSLFDWLMHITLIIWTLLIRSNTRYLHWFFSYNSFFKKKFYYRFFCTNALAAGFKLKITLHSGGFFINFYFIHMKICT